MKVLQNGRMSDFQRDQFVGLARTSVNKTATWLSVSRAAVSKVVTAYTNHGKTSSAKKNSGRKPKFSERDHRTLKRIVSKKITILLR
jgi:transposase